MADGMQSTRSSRRLAELKSGVIEASGSATRVKGGKMSGAAKVEKCGLPDDVYIPCWNLSKMSRLISLEEQREWTDNLMPPGASNNF